MSETYTEFFLNAQASLRLYDTLEISHPNFTQTYRIVRNAPSGLTVTVEDSTSANFIYYPVKIVGLSNNQNLDQTIQVQFGDLGSILPQELDAVAQAGGFLTKPTCIYRGYRSDDLLAPMIGPFVLEIINFQFAAEGAAFEASAPQINSNRTGESYELARFPMLRGFLT